MYEPRTTIKIKGILTTTKSSCIVKIKQTITEFLDCKLTDYIF